jgi:hypothetical protein
MKIMNGGYEVIMIKAMTLMTFSVSELVQIGFSLCETCMIEKNQSDI